TTGVYESDFQAPPAAVLPPVIQFIPDRVTKVGQQVSFLVEASSPQGTPVTLVAAPLPTGASFTAQPADPKSPTVARASFSWTPGTGSVGNYLINYTATDGTLSASRAASIRVESDEPPPGPGTPTIDSPLSGASVTGLRPLLKVMTSADARDPTTKLQFEVYADEAMTQKIASAVVDKAPSAPGNGAGTVVQPTGWQVPVDLGDNTKYWWRARAFDGKTIYSPWVNGRFFVNTVNDPPNNFNLATPAAGSEVITLTPTLSWANSLDKDGDAITYSVAIYKDAALADIVVQVENLTETPGGSTSWTVSKPLTNGSRYYWRVVAKDAIGAQTPTPARQFTVVVGNRAPSVPTIVSPAVGGQSASSNTALTVSGSTDPEKDPITYVFEIDTVNTFNSSAKQASGKIKANSAGGASWTTAMLVENKRYWWRAKAQDGKTESDWVVGDFLMNAANDPPPTPTVKNPGNGAWVGSTQPSLEVNPAVDPEGDAVHYEFYGQYFNFGYPFRPVKPGTPTTNQTWTATSSTTASIVPIELIDKRDYVWQVRAIDAQGASSAWSEQVHLYVSTSPYQNPSIAVTAPATTMPPDIQNSNGQVKSSVTIRWEGTNPNMEHTVALYYGTSKADFNGNLILDGIHAPAGTTTGEYVVNVGSLAAGTYYFYAVIYDGKGIGKAYAPGAVVISEAQPTGGVYAVQGGVPDGYVTTENGMVTPLRPVRGIATSESGTSAVVDFTLASKPTAEVVVPLSTSSRSALVSPGSLVFTPENYYKYQRATLTGRNNCIPDGGTRYELLVGKTKSTDPNYNGIVGAKSVVSPDMSVLNADDSNLPPTTDNDKLHICGWTLVSERETDQKAWEYTLRAELTNTGESLKGVTAYLAVSNMPDVKITKQSLVFGAVAEGETVTTTDTVVLQSKTAVSKESLVQGGNFKWRVEPKKQ
ncbi:hypothetical protein NU688_21525, partial [Variovorax sp. ZS18.2.2]|uniref:hypothetical protein n=1 Tax=Variovorax sp. ZS18.2.2 TaxID=2971255 RepID=UPI0021514D2B